MSTRRISVGPLGTGEFEGLPTGIDQWRRLCAKNYGGLVAGKFCAGNEPPRITSLAELQTMFLGFQMGIATTRELSLPGYRRASACAR